MRGGEGGRGRLKIWEQAARRCDQADARSRNHRPHRSHAPHLCHVLLLLLGERHCLHHFLCPRLPCPQREGLQEGRRGNAKEGWGGGKARLRAGGLEAVQAGCPKKQEGAAARSSATTHGGRAPKPNSTCVGSNGCCCCCLVPFSVFCRLAACAAAAGKASAPLPARMSRCTTTPAPEGSWATPWLHSSRGSSAVVVTCITTGPGTGLAARTPAWQQGRRPSSRLESVVLFIKGVG